MPMSRGFSLQSVVVQAEIPVQLALVRELFREYADGLPIDLAYQGFDTELASLPGAYAPPHGRLLLAMVDETAAGCVALRPLSDTICELKRLYVRPAFRHLGLGRYLTRYMLNEASTIGYEYIRLDTLPSMHSAIHLYESLGFVRCAPYYPTPIADTVFMERRLADRATNGE